MTIHLIRKHRSTIAIFLVIVVALLIYSFGLAFLGTPNEPKSHEYLRVPKSATEAIRGLYSDDDFTRTQSLGNLRWLSSKLTTAEAVELLAWCCSDKYNEEYLTLLGQTCVGGKRVIESLLVQRVIELRSEGAANEPCARTLSQLLSKQNRRYKEVLESGDPVTLEKDLREILDDRSRNWGS